MPVLQSPRDRDSEAEPPLRAQIPPAPAPAEISGNLQSQLGAVGDLRGFQLDTPSGMRGEAPTGRALLLSETEDQLLCTRFKQCLEAKSFPKLAGLGRDVLFVSVRVRERFIK